MGYKSSNNKLTLSFTLRCLVMLVSVMFAGSTFADTSPDPTSTGSEDDDVAAQFGNCKITTPATHIVVFKNNTGLTPAQLQQHLIDGYGCNIVHVYTAVFNGVSMVLTAEQVKTLQQDPYVASVTVNETASLSSTATSASKPILPGPLSCPSGIVTKIGACIPTSMIRIGSAYQASNGEWKVPSIQNNDVVVAVLDTGIDATHPDLNVRQKGISCFFKSVNKTTPSDQNGHGTFVASVVGGKNTPGGLVGVAPGVPLYSIQVCNEFGGCLMDDVACGLDWLIKNGPKHHIKVANMSLHHSGTDDGNCGYTPSIGLPHGDLLQQAVCAVKAQNKITMVAAAGQADPGGTPSDFVSRLAGGLYGYGWQPAGLTGLLSVTAILDNDGKPGGLGPDTSNTALYPDAWGTKDDGYWKQSDFISWIGALNGTTGQEKLFETLTAPAVEVIGAAPQFACTGPFTNGYGFISKGCYGTGAGTSLSAPVISGTVALCYAGYGCNPVPQTASDMLQKIAGDAKLYGQKHPEFEPTSAPRVPPPQPLLGPYPNTPTPTGNFCIATNGNGDRVSVNSYLNFTITDDDCYNMNNNFGFPFPSPFDQLPSDIQYDIWWNEDLVIVSATPTPEESFGQYYGYLPKPLYDGSDYCDSRKQNADCPKNPFYDNR